MTQAESGPRYRARFHVGTTVQEWVEVDEWQAQGLFLDGDYDVEPINAVAKERMWGP